MGASTIYLIGNSHIDPIWLWRWSEGQQIIRSTFLRAVELLRQHESFIFHASSAAFYRLVEETDPVLFEEIRAYVRRGRWRIVGGWWVEPDCNLPSGESMARQSLYGQRYFMTKFGVRAEVGYNIDSFGHNAMMPQILSNSGIKFYVFMRPGPQEKTLPCWAFIWSSSDGSEIIAHRIIGSYAASGDKIVELVRSTINELRPPTDSLMCFVGEGDHGGGLKAEDLKTLDELRESFKPLELKFAPIEEYFSSLDSRKADFPLVKDELQHHASGCYAAVSRVKKLNRHTEEALIAAEKYAFMASTLTGTSYPRQELYRAWTNLLFCQFHDALAGSCIKEAYEGDIYPMLEETLSIASRVSGLSIQSIASKLGVKEKGSVIVFNPHAYPLRAPVEVDLIGGVEPPKLLNDRDGRFYDCQQVRGSAVAGGVSKLVFLADLDALGYKEFALPHEDNIESRSHDLSADDSYLENKRLKVILNRSEGTFDFIFKDCGDRASVVDGASAVVIDDESDTWSHGVFRFDEVIGQFHCESVQLLESGPVRVVMRAKYVYGDSHLTQDFILYNDLDYLLCNVNVDWHERRKMLKFAFPIRVREPEATYEIQYGTIKRPTTGEEEPGLRWVDMTGRSGTGDVLGLTLINDSKYSYDARGNVLRLTILRSPPFAHHEPAKLDPRFDYEYIDQGSQFFTYALRPHRGSLEPWEASRIADALTAPPFASIESEHHGSLPTTTSLAHISEPNVILKVIKKSEDADEWILRFFETSGKRTRTIVTLNPLGVKFDTEFRPHEIKTFAISSKEKGVRMSNIVDE